MPHCAPISSITTPAVNIDKKNKCVGARANLSYSLTCAGDGSFKTDFNPERLERSWVNMLSFGLFDRNEPLTFDYRP